MKNIPTHGNDFYIKILIKKAEKFVKNIRWRTFFFLHPELKKGDKETNGFISTNTQPVKSELKDSENNVTELIQNIKFKHHFSKIQNQLTKDLKHIKKDNHLYVPTDKTNNYYGIKPEFYEQLLNKAVFKE